MHPHSPLFLLLLALLLPSTSFGSFCGKSGVPYSFEVLSNGAPVLGCAQPSCVIGATDAEGDFQEDSQFFSNADGQSDGFFRDGDRALKRFRHTAAPKLIANCSGQFNELSCPRKNQWVGGIEYIDHPRQPLILQCCTFEGLRFSQEVGATTIGPGEAITGGEVVRSGRQISFDVIANVRKVAKSDGESTGKVQYEVTVRRMNCLPDPPEPEVEFDGDVPSEVSKVLGSAKNKELTEKTAAGAGNSAGGKKSAAAKQPKGGKKGVLAKGKLQTLPAAMQQPQGTLPEISGGEGDRPGQSPQASLGRNSEVSIQPKGRAPGAQPQQFQSQQPQQQRPLPQGLPQQPQQFVGPQLQPNVGGGTQFIEQQQNQPQQPQQQQFQPQSQQQLPPPQFVPIQQQQQQQQEQSFQSSNFQGGQLQPQQPQQQQQQFNGDAVTASAGASDFSSPASATPHPLFGMMSFPTLPPHSFPTLPPHSFPTLPPHSFPTLPPHTFPTLPPHHHHHSFPTLPPHTFPTFAPHGFSGFVGHTAAPSGGSGGGFVSPQGSNPNSPGGTAFAAPTFNAAASGPIPFGSAGTFSGSGGAGGQQHFREADNSITSQSVAGGAATPGQLPPFQLQNAPTMAPAMGTILAAMQGERRPIMHPTLGVIGYSNSPQGGKKRK